MEPIAIMNKERNDKNTSNKSASIWLYFFTFLVLYTPTIFPNEILNYILPFLYCGFTFLLKREPPSNTIFRKRFRTLVFFLIIATIYFCIRTLLAGTSITDVVHLRLVQSFQLIASIISIYNINNHLTVLGYSMEKKLRFLLNICMIQFFAVLVMVVFPNLRTVLLERLYSSGDEHYWTLSRRVYGVMMDYTYAGAIFHGIMLVIAYSCGITKNKKFLFYMPFLLVMILLNGRTGLFIGVGGIILSTFMLISKRNVIRLIKYGFLAILSFFVVFQIIKYSFPSTYTFIQNGVNDMASILFKEEQTGNVSVLSNNISSNMNFESLLVGNGHRIQNPGDIPSGIEFNYSYSDMGYLNDMFMGGLPYMLMLYIPTIALVMTYRKGNRFSLTISIFLLLTLLFCNFKGEVFRSSILISCAIYLKAAIEQYEQKEIRNG